MKNARSSCIGLFWSIFLVFAAPDSIYSQVPQKKLKPEKPVSGYEAAASVKTYKTDTYRDQTFPLIQLPSEFRAQRYCFALIAGIIMQFSRGFNI